ncbi:MAG: hypothetical protein H7318_19605 [Oligoflexus sp.]|nr:hypothetical protein [Oligoflexus sp.]
MFRSAADWQGVWASYEGHSLEKIEKALIALSEQLGIEPEVEDGKSVYSQHVAQFLDKVLEESKKND